MRKIVELDVKIISIETIKPSIPTPSHLRTYKLSLLDQIHPPYYTIMLLFYPVTTELPRDGVNINVLKNSLSKTLSKYYPFAGRCIDDFTVDCNDHGIPFIETRVEYVLSEFLASSNKVDFMYKLTPPDEFQTDKSLPERVPLAFQVNVFLCGGVVISCFKLHKLLLDGTSLVAFLKHWAAVALSLGGRNGEVPVAPNFDAVLSAFPPRPDLNWTPFDLDSPERQARLQECRGMHMAVRSFVFTKHAISALRANAASKEVPKPTRFETLAGFVWQHCMAAALCAGTMPVDALNPSTLLFLVNMRTRLTPTLTNVTMGNLITNISISASCKQPALTELVRNIHLSLTKVGDTIESYKGGQNVKALVDDIGPIFRHKRGMYELSSWCQFKLDEIDFGFGKPKWASPTNGVLSPVDGNLIYFATDATGDGIKAWLILEEKEMQALESNKEFLAFACPN